MVLRRVIKILHTLGASGMLGGLAGILLLISLAPQATPQAYADMRGTVSLLADFVLLPSLAAVLISGLLAMVAHSPYMNKGWALLKAAFGIIMFKGTLHITGAIGEYADNVAAYVASNGAQPSADVVHQFAYEGVMLWTLLVLSAANVIVGVWRPKLSFRFGTETNTGTDTGTDTGADTGAAGRPMTGDTPPAWTRR